MAGDAVEREVVRPFAAGVRAAAFRRVVDRGLDDAYRLAAVLLGDRATSWTAPSPTGSAVP